MSPEQEACIEIDRMLAEAGWLVQDVKNVNLHAGRGVAIREVSLKPGYGEVDYLLYIDGQAAGVIEAKKAGVTLAGVEIQSDKYAKGLKEQFRQNPNFFYEARTLRNHNA